MISQLKFFLKNLFELLSQAPKRKIFTVYFLLIVQSLLDTIGIGLVGPVIAAILDINLLIDNIPVDSLKEYFLSLTKNQIIFNVLVVFFGVYLLKSILSLLIQIISANIYLKIGEKYSNILINSYFLSDWNYVLNKNTSNIFRDTINIAYQLPYIVLLPFLGIIAEAGFLFFTFVLLINLNPTILLIGILSAILTKFLYHLLTYKTLLKIGSSRLKIDSLRVKNLFSIIGLLREIRILNARQYFLNKNIQILKDLTKLETSASKYDVLPKIVFELLFIFLISTLVLTQLFYSLDQESLLISLGIFSAAAIRIIPSFNRITNYTSKIITKKKTIENFLGQISSSKLKITDQIVEEKSSKIINFDKIKIQNLSYSYLERENEVFKKLNFEIEKGKMVGLKGESGSGKSTLLNCVAGILPDYKGKIEIDNNDQKKLQKDWLYSCGYVSQEVFLLDDTIKRNIALGKEDADIDILKVKESVKISGLENFIESKTQKLDFQIGENGRNLSGGQKQRLSIARSLYNECSILILDEITSSLDFETTKKIVENIKYIRDKKKLTILIASHDEFVLENCDKIIRLD